MRCQFKDAVLLYMSYKDYNLSRSFIFVTGNSYSCAHGTSLNIRLLWDRLTFIVVKHPLHIMMPLGSSAVMMFLFLVVPNIWQWMSFKLSFEVMLKNIAIYICHPFSGAVVFESSALCEIWSAEEMWSIWHVICIKNQHICWYWFVDLHFSRLLCSSAQDQRSTRIIAAD